MLSKPVFKDPTLGLIDMYLSLSPRAPRAGAPQGTATTGDAGDGPAPTVQGDGASELPADIKQLPDSCRGPQSTPQTQKIKRSRVCLSENTVVSAQVQIAERVALSDMCSKQHPLRGGETAGSPSL